LQIASSPVKHKRQAAVASKPMPPAGGTQPLLLTEGSRLLGKPPSLLQALTSQERELLLGAGRRLAFRRGQTLFSQGSEHAGIFILDSGRVRVFYTAPSGREITRAYWDAGNFVGGSEILGSGHHHWSCVAQSACSVVQIRGSELRELARAIPNLAIALIDGLTFKIKCFTALTQMLGTRSIAERLAHLLLHLVELYGVRVSDGIAIRSVFTHAELANMVGATRQWVTININRLEQEHIISCRKSWIVIRRLDALLAMRG
jgi:CRP/FNR family transcriptional regulator, cyclic AMP receptor protein